MLPESPPKQLFMRIRMKRWAMRDQRACGQETQNTSPSSTAPVELAAGAPQYTDTLSSPQRAIDTGHLFGRTDGLYNHFAYHITHIIPTLTGVVHFWWIS